MSVNDLTFNQISTVLANIASQASGKTIAAPINTSEFVSVAQLALKTGYDPLKTAISQVLSKTIFSNRYYNRKFKGLEADALRWGNHVRKLNPVDTPFEDDPTFELEDGQSIDHYTVLKPKTVQTNFYGQNVYKKKQTIYTEQLDAAFSSEADFRAWLNMTLLNARNQIEKAHEETARETILNLIGGTIAGGNDMQVVHLITEYKAFIGESGEYNVYDPSNFPMFARWLFGRIKTLSQKLEERSIAYHTNFDEDRDIERFSPVRDQRLYIYTPDINTVDATVLSNTFNDDYLKLLPYEGVTFWQAIKEPNKINVNVTYMQTNGELATSDFESDKVLGILIDREAAGYTVMGEKIATTPLNASGLYFNQIYHFRDRYWNDFSENSVVLMLD